jgi:hypothetical protein
MSRSVISLLQYKLQGLFLRKNYIYSTPPHPLNIIRCPGFLFLMLFLH